MNLEETNMEETHLTQEEMDDINRFLNENYDMLVALS
jgi:hypothetical protein